MLEVQVHPQDVRRPVRYYFLPARTVAWLGAGAVAAVGLLACGVLLAPRGVEALLLRARTDQALRENRDQTDAIRRQAEQLRQLEQRVEAAAMLQSRLALVFGAAETESFAGGRSGPAPGDAASPVAALELAGELHLATDRLLRSAASLGALVEEQRGLARIVPSVCPLPRDAFVLTSPFGNRRSPFTGQGDFHAGIDLAARVGVPVSAPADGRALIADTEASYYGYYDGFSASELVQSGGQTYLIATPTKDDAYRGCLVFTIENLTTAPALKQTGGVADVKLAVSGSTGSFNGACGYTAGLTQSGIIYSEFFPGQTPEFRLFGSGQNL